MNLISVVMAAPDYKTRLKDAAFLLDYGFSRCSIYEDKDSGTLPLIPVRQGIKKTVPVRYEEPFRYLSTDGNKITEADKKYILPESVKAPVKKGTRQVRSYTPMAEKNLAGFPFCIPNR